MRKFEWDKRGKILAVSFLAAAFAVTGGLAVQGHSRAAQYRQLLDNSYQHAFSELTGAVSGLDVALQKGLYATTPPLFATLCTQAYSKALSAQMALGELPYGNLELEQTAAFLAKTGDYAMALSRSAYQNGGCTDADRETLRGLSAGAASLAGTLRGLQSDLYAGSMTLEDLQSAEHRLSAATEKGDIPADSAFQTVESDFPEVPALIYDGPFSEHLTSRTPAMLEGRGEVTQDEARASAAKFLDLRPEIFDFVSDGSGKVPTYSFSAAVDGGALYVEVTRMGGLVMEVVGSRPVGEAVLSRAEAQQVAGEFLALRGYPNMAESYFIDQGNVLTVNFAAAQDSVLCYPDLVKVSVALDTGSIVGFESKGYLMNHQNRTLEQPAVSLPQAQRVVADGLSILTHQLALIPTGGSYEVLCHEFKCETDTGSHVIVYVNAQTGLEEKILILLEDESGTLAL